MQASFSLSPCCVAGVTQKHIATYCKLLHCCSIVQGDATNPPSRLFLLLHSCCSCQPASSNATGISLTSLQSWFKGEKQALISSVICLHFQVTGLVLSCVYLGWFLSQSPFWLLAWWTRAFSLSWRKRLKIEPSREGELPQPSSASAWSCSTSLYSYILVWCSYYMVYSFKHLQEARLHHNVGGTNNNDINIILVVITSVGRVSSLQVWNRGLVPGSCDLNPIWHPFVETLQPDLFHKLKSVLISIKTFCP